MVQVQQAGAGEDYGDSASGQPGPASFPGRLTWRKMLASSAGDGCCSCGMCAACAAIQASAAPLVYRVVVLPGPQAAQVAWHTCVGKVHEAV